MSSPVSGRSTRATGRRSLAALAVVATTATGLVGLTPSPSAAAAPNVYPGAAYAWGGDNSRQLGDGLRVDDIVRTPAAAVGLTGVDRVLSRLSGTYAHTADGWSGWGFGSGGEMCLGNFQTQTNYVPAATGIPPTATSVSANGDNDNVLFVDEGVVRGCGRSSGLAFGNLGGSRFTTPATVPGLPEEDFVEVFNGPSEHFAVQSDGTVWGWGQNLDGALGLGTTGTRSTPAIVAALSNVRAISSSVYHTLVLRGDGTVLAIGNNNQGQLGDGTTAGQRTPVPVTGLADVVEIVAGLGSSVALKSDGTVWTWGAGSEGQLGLGLVTSALTPQQVTGLPPVAHLGASRYVVAAVTTGGEVYTWGRFDLRKGAPPVMTPTVVAGVHDAVALSVGAFHVSVVLADQTVVSWGDNSVGAIGNGVLPAEFNPRTTPGPVVAPGNARIVDIQGGQSTAYALTDTGAVLAWGSNLAGALGTGSTAVGASVPTPVSGLASGVTSIAGGGFFSAFAVTGAGSLMAWGSNTSGELGDGTTDNRSTPVAISGLGGPVAAVAAGTYHALAAMADGTVRAWGNISYGSLGDGTTTSSPTPVVVQGLADIVGVAAGEQVNYAVSATGALYGWGLLSPGTGGSGLRVEAAAPQLIAGLPPVVSVSTAGSTVAALDANGGIWTWGNNVRCQTGDTAGEWVQTPTLVALPQRTAKVVASSSHMVALLEDGSVWTWGANDNGQLGIGTQTACELPTQVPGLPPVVVAVGAASDATYAIAGANTRSRVSIGSAQIAEGASGSRTLTFPVTLDRPEATTVKVTYATSDGTATQPGDYLAKTGTLTFAAGVTTQTVTVRVYGDIAVEPDETFAVTLTGVTTGTLPSP